MSRSAPIAEISGDFVDDAEENGIESTSDLTHWNVGENLIDEEAEDDQSAKVIPHGP